MRFYTSAFALAAFAAQAIAQAANLAFTSTPPSVISGQSYTIKYQATDSTDPVTITLRKGDPNNLQTVATLTSTSTGGSYTWTVSSDLPNASDYALQITQGNSINYSGEFPLSGSSAGTSSSSSSLAGYSSSSSSAVYSSSSSLTGYVPYTTSSAKYNSTVSYTAGPTAYPGTVSALTSTALPRNTTLSIATLTSASSSASATVASSSTKSAAGYQSTSASASAPASTGGAASVISGSSPLALVLVAVAGVFL